MTDDNIPSTVSNDDLWTLMQQRIEDRLHEQFPDLPADMDQWFRLLAFSELTAQFVSEKLQTLPGQQHLREQAGEWARIIPATMGELIREMELVDA